MFRRVDSEALTAAAAAAAAADLRPPNPWGVRVRYFSLMQYYKAVAAEALMREGGPVLAVAEVVAAFSTVRVYPQPEAIRAGVPEGSPCSLSDRAAVEYDGPALVDPT